MSELKKKTIYLHVGTTKTGSTSIQMLLKENKEILRQKNFVAYTPCRLQGADCPRRMRGLAEYLSLFSLALPTSKKWAGWFDSFLQEIKQEPADHVILSEECLWNTISSWRKRRRFAFLIHELQAFADVKVLVYLRRQDNYLMSAYQQCLKGCQMNGLTCRQWLCWMHDGDARADYSRALKWLLRLMVKENLIVRAFEPEQFFNGSLLADFLHHVGLDIDDGFDIPLKKRNPGLSPFLAEILRCLGFFYTEKNAIRPFLSLRRKGDERYFNRDREHQFLSPEDRCRLMQEHQAGNRWVAQEFFGRANGVLFYDPLPSADDSWREFQLHEEEVRSFFDEMDDLKLSREQRVKMCEQVLSVINRNVPRRVMWVNGIVVLVKRIRQKLCGLAGRNRI